MLTWGGRTTQPSTERAPQGLDEGFLAFLQALMDDEDEGRVMQPEPLTTDPDES